MNYGTDAGSNPASFLIFMKKPSRELLELCSTDNRKAHYELYQMSFGFLVSVCRRYYVNTEDMRASLNMIYLKMIRNLPAYLKKERDVPFELWTRRIAINYIIDEFRKNRNYREKIDLKEIYESEEIHPVADPTPYEDRLEEIEDAVNMLPGMSKAVFNLYVVDGYKHEEIAQMLDISANTSKVHLHRARMKLREILTNNGKKKQLTFNHAYHG